MNDIDKCKYCKLCTEEEKRTGNKKCKMPVPLDGYEGKVPDLYIGKDGLLHPM